MTPKSSSIAKLMTDDFAARVGFFHSPTLMRSTLRDSPDVRQIAVELRRGVLTDEMLGEFAKSEAAKFKPGERLEGDLALAALAVIFEHRYTNFAEDYLFGMARLKLAEMPISIRVARECLKGRMATPKNEVQSFRFSRIRSLDRPAFTRIARRFRDWRVERSSNAFPKQAKVAQ